MIYNKRTQYKITSSFQ